MNNMNEKVVNAAKWSILTEIAAKAVAPITSMILARLLTPDAFGVVATVAMVFSFADMFADAGFQKYLIQHEFKSDEEKDKSTTVAFWTNLAISFLLFGIIAIFNEQLAVVVGNPGLGNVFIVACISLPLTSFSSIQMSLFKRDFDFKSLFFARIVAVCIPFVITVPLAFIFENYWALIIGTICGNFSTAIIMTIKSKWKPKMFYSIKLLKEMMSFSFWSLIEAIALWLTNYIGIFIIGIYMTSYYIGLYKTAMNTVNQIIAIITTATTSVLFSSLSRLQDDRIEFKNMFFKFQRLVGMIVVPMGVGIYIYRYFITNILLGSQWAEAADFIGLWGLMSALTIVLSQYCSEIYRSIGKPKLSVISQLLHLAALIPVLIYGAKQDFQTLYILRSLVRIQAIIVNLIITYFAVHISPVKMITNVLPYVISATLMGGVAYFMQSISNYILWNIISIIVCIAFYFGVLMLFFPKCRTDIFTIFKKFKP